MHNPLDPSVVVDRVPLAPTFVLHDMTWAEAKALAQKHAARRPEYYYRGADFQPHPWVIEAILEAANGSRGLQ